MAEMTAAEVKELFESQSFDGTISNQESEGIWSLIQQQQQQIEAMKCCGNCVNWRNRPEKMSCKIHEIDVAQWCRCGEWQVKEGQ